MDSIGFRELLETAFVLCERRFRALSERSPDLVSPRDAEVELVLDRLAQTGILLLRNGLADAWRELMDTLRRIFQLAVPEEETYLNVYFPPRNADFLLAVIERVFFLGAYARRLEKFDFARVAIVQLPDPALPHHYWIRYAVTMVARGEVASYRGKKSLIPVASEYLRTRPDFFELFRQNMDNVVNDMCQFDFFGCVIATHLADDVYECYPNFGLYWNHRTIPIVVDLVTNGLARQAVPEIDDDRLAEILRALDDVTAQAFFDFSGWSRNQWEDKRIIDFLKHHPPKSSHTG